LQVNCPAVTVTYRSVEGQNPLSTGPIWSRVDSHVAEFRLSQCDPSDVARLVAAMLQARDAVESRSWSHRQEPTTEEWWADVLADPRARIPKRRSDYTAKQAFYRLADELRDTILVACSKCDWKAAFRRDELITARGAALSLATREVFSNWAIAPSTCRTNRGRSVLGEEIRGRGRGQRDAKRFEKSCPVSCTV
jgi:hypothetical protein